MDEEGVSEPWEITVCEEHAQLLRMGEDWITSDNDSEIRMGSDIPPKVVEYQIELRESREGLVQLKLATHSQEGFVWQEFLVDRPTADSLVKTFRHIAGEQD